MGVEIGVIREKILWLVPNWECNRGENPCKICFVSKIMEDARANNYLHARSDFYPKVGLLSRLPFKEVVITGGEPTQDPEILAATLDSIDPQKFIRIITNGDWVLQNDPRGVLLIIGASKRRIRIELSAHDRFGIFKQKMEALIDKKVEVGVQVRHGETKNDEAYCNYISRNYGKKVFVEVHDVLALGQAKTPQGLFLDLSKLVSYTVINNMGIYVVAGERGARVIANHEAPYLVYPTPADIGLPEDKPEEILQQVIDFYKFPSLRRSKIEGYAVAAFRAGQPVFGTYLTSQEEAKSIANGYYEVIAERSQMSTDDVKKIVIEAIVTKMLKLVRLRKIPYLVEIPPVYDIACRVPRDANSLAALIVDGLIRTYDGNNYKMSDNDRKKGPLINFLDHLKAVLGFDYQYTYYIERAYSEKLLQDLRRRSYVDRLAFQLSLLGISLEDIKDLIEAK